MGLDQETILGLAGITATVILAGLVLSTGAARGNEHEILLLAFGLIGGFAGLSEYRKRKSRASGSSATSTGDESESTPSGESGGGTDSDPPSSRSPPPE